MPTQAKAALMLSLLAATINFAFFFIIVWALPVVEALLR